MSDRLDKAERLREIEQYVKMLENNLIGIDSLYFQDGVVKLEINTDDFKFDELDNDEGIEFTKSIMVDFIKKQLEQHKMESKQILKDLIEDE